MKGNCTENKTHILHPEHGSALVLHSEKSSLMKGFCLQMSLATQDVLWLGADHNSGGNFGYQLIFYPNHMAIHQIHVSKALKNWIAWGLKDGLLISEHVLLLERAQLSFQHPDCGSKTAGTPVSGDPMHSSELPRYQACM